MVESVPLPVLKLRIRDRIIGYLELASSAEKQRNYERRVPIAHVPAEVIEQWDDWVQDKSFNFYSEPEFSIDEREAMKRFEEVLSSVVEETPDDMPSSIESLIGTSVWQRLMQAAEEALSVFVVRGRTGETIWL